MIRLFVLSAIIALSFSGCFSSQPKKVELPQWYHAPMHDSATHYYAKAIANSKKEATIQALNDIASRISISVESSLTTHKHAISSTTGSAYYSRSIYQQIKNSVRAIEFSDYQTLQHQQLSNGKHTVLIALDRQKNARLMAEKISLKAQNHQALISTRDQNIVSKLQNYSEAIQQIDTTLLPNCFVIKTLDHTLPIEQQINDLTNIRTSMQAFKNSLKLRLTSTTKKSKQPFFSHVQSALTHQGYTLTQSKKTDLTVVMDLESDQVIVFGKYVYKATVTLSVYSHGKLLNSKMVKVGGTSSASVAQAKIFAAQHFEKRLGKEKVINKLLGM